ncbi:MAG: phosphoribosylglycinamide formyltransferase [Actinomycetes bacterium]
MRLAVLLSGSGTNLAALLDAIDADPGFGGEVVVVGSDVPDAGGLERARARDIPTVVEVLAEHPDRPTWEDALADALAAHEPDLVVLAGFMRIVSGRFLSRWPDRVVNTHPSLLPAFPGAHAVRDALAHGVKVTGSTVHLVDEQVDHGPILAQQAVEVRPDDTEDALHERIKAVEHVLFPECVRALCQGRVHLDGRVVTVTPA